MTRNTYIGIGIAAVVLVAVFFMFRHSGEIRNYPPKDGPIVAFGDSLTAGVGASDGNNYVSILSRKIGEPIQNFGVSGDTTVDALARIDSVITKQPRIAIVLLGGNDFLNKLPRENTFLNLKTIISKFQASGAVVVLLGIRAGLFFNTSSSDFEKLASDTGSVYVPDVLDGLFGDPKYMSDEVHPNDAGYAIIANKVYSTIKGILR